MTSSPDKWYGWIPTLTGNIFLSNPFKDRTKYKPLEKYSDKIPRNIVEELNHGSYALVKEKYFSGNAENEGKSIVIYAFKKDDHNYLEHLYILRTKKDNIEYELFSRADIISLSEKGLLEFNVYQITSSNPLIAREAVNQIYIDIRDVYHKHTHHGKGDQIADSPVPICLKRETVEEAICGILHLFLKKIDLYHETIEPYIHAKEIIITGAVEAIRQATGEFIYAQNFCIKFGDRLDPDTKEEYIQIFENSIKSMNAFLNEINGKYSHDTAIRSSEQNKILLVMTLLLLGLTVAMLIK